MRPKGTAAELEQRRVDAVRQLRSGERVVAVARSLGVSTTAVQNWKRVVKNDGGLRALRAKPQHVPLCRLTAQQKRRLRTVLLRGAAAAGFATDLWTCARVAEVIRRECGVQYNPSHVGRMLHGMNFSCQKPERLAREHDEAAANEFRTETWPRLKKGRKTRS